MSFNLNSTIYKDAETALPSYGWAYFEHLIAEYDSLSPDQKVKIPESAQKVVETVRGYRPTTPNPYWVTIGAILLICGLLALLWLLFLVPSPITVTKLLLPFAVAFLIWIVSGHVLKLYITPAPSPTWGQLYLLDTTLTRIIDGDLLQRKIWDVRRRYRNIVGPSTYEDYLHEQAVLHTDPNTKTLSAEEIEELRFDLQNLVRELHWNYSIYAKLEKTRARLSTLAATCIGLLMLCTCGLLAVVVLSSPPINAATPTPTLVPTRVPVATSTPTLAVQTGSASSSLPPASGASPPGSVTSGLAPTATPAPVPTPTSTATPAPTQTPAPSLNSPLTTNDLKHTLLLLLVITAGATGGFFSMQRRLQSAANSDTYTTLISLERGGDVAALISPLSGAVFAVLLTLVFVGDFVSGSMFPHFISDSNGKESIYFADFLIHTHAATGADIAKLLVWSFLAGFAEQFVPDVLNRIVNRSQNAAEDAAKAA